MSVKVDPSVVIGAIVESAKSHSNEPRFVRVMDPGFGDTVRQGDVYVRAIDAERFEDLKQVKTGDRQVAVGTTVGSRHVAEGDLDVFRRVGQGGVFGPVIHARERWCLVHPEHADFSLPAGFYEVGYQLDEETGAAVLD